MAAIRSSIEVALSGGRTNEEYEELLADIIEESASLELLVNQLLLLSETETERLKVDKQQVQFDELVEKAMDMFGGVAEYRDIRTCVSRVARRRWCRAIGSTCGKWSTTCWTTR